MTFCARRTDMRVGLFALGAILASTAARADELKIGDRASELDVAVDAAGKSFKLKSMKGKWILLTIGADWCDACKKELPAWDKLAPTYKGKVEFVAINANDAIDDGKKFNRKLGLKNLMLVYLPADKSAVVANYGSAHMPTTYLIDGQGVVRYIRDGFEKGDVDGELKKMRDQLAKLVK
jgi:thiol-disulfide isomerase/thioredoxin